MTSHKRSIQLWDTDAGIRNWLSEEAYEYWLEVYTAQDRMTVCGELLDGLLDEFDEDGKATVQTVCRMVAWEEENGQRFPGGMKI